MTYSQELRRRKNHKESIWEKFKLSVLFITYKKACYAESGELGGILIVNLEGGAPWVKG